ncbi:MAG: HIT family protein [Gammaproteobacteria bacterium]|nr:HIT family protein [Gammaproteobacteria bacterium]
MSVCPLCHPTQETVLWNGGQCRVILVEDAAYPGFCRVIWQAHVKEMTDLALAQRHDLMSVVFAVEQALRETLRPDKINLASLGNQVPHLHWHVIPRFADDAHFPDPIWAAARREGQARQVDVERLTQALARRIPADWSRE